MFRDWEAPINDALGDVSSALSWNPIWTTEAYRDTGYIMNFLRHDQDDYFQIKLQFNHQRKLQSLLDDIHLHLIPMANGTGNVYLQIQYFWSNPGEVIPATTGWTTTYKTIPIAPTDLYMHALVGLLTNVTPPNNEKASSILLVKITRLWTNILDTYTANKDHWSPAANIAVMYLDAHTKTERFWWPIV